MGRKVQKISDLVIDEVSLVDKGANQHAVVTIAKSADGVEEEMSMDDLELFDEQGQLLDVASLQEGDTVYDEDGTEYEIEYDDADDELVEDEPNYEEERVPAMVGKSDSPFRRGSVSKSQTDYATEIRKALSSATTDSERDEIITKALGETSALKQEVEIAKRAAETERQIRIEKEYTEIAKSYNLPIDDAELGGVLMRAAESLPVEDCEVIAKCMEAAGAAIFQEYGMIGGGDNADVMDQVTATVSKSNKEGARMSEADVASFFDANPDLYDEYLSESKHR